MAPRGNRPKEDPPSTCSRCGRQYINEGKGCPDPKCKPPVDEERQARDAKKAEKEAFLETI
jgi:hypothetical protein